MREPTATLTVVLTLTLGAVGGAASNELVVDASPEPAGPRIHRNVYGHFSEHLGRGVYGGIWVGEDSEIPNTRGIRNDVVDALRAIEVPVLRWPGGCFADAYYWKDGIGPRAERRRTVNIHWGPVIESNEFGTHEFMDLCEQIGAEAYLAGNVGSGTPDEMLEWIEYVTLEGGSSLADQRVRNGREEPWPLRYFGVGNESWGCGGNMRAEHYADVYRRYQTYVRDFGEGRIERIAGGASGRDFHWTEVLMREAGELMSGLSLHYYVVPGEWSEKGSATGFGEREWFGVMQKAAEADEVIGLHADIMDRHDPERRVSLVVDEWGTWYDVEPDTEPEFLYQQNTLRDALVAGILLNTFNRHAERVRGANLAQMVNVLQALILTEGRRMVLTPTYHVFEMYKVHQDATALPIELTSQVYWRSDERVAALDVSASRDDEGRLHVSICNLDPRRGITLSGIVSGLEPTRISGRVLTGEAMDLHNSFGEPRALEPDRLEDVELTADGFRVRLPPKSVTVLELE